MADVEHHVSWQKNLAARLPPGSSFRLEMAHNGNGNIMDATLGAGGDLVCVPEEAVYYEYLPDPPHEVKKPINTGVDQWPTWAQQYQWQPNCTLSSRDPLTQWFAVPANRDEFSHISHTFTHLNQNNITYADAYREIKFNQDWLKQIGIDQARYYSGKGLVPPQITGLYNADALKAWLDAGLDNAVGDNTRPMTRNPDNAYWPLITNVDRNGYDGVTIIPRYATRIYYNCHTHACNFKEWQDTSAGTGNFNELLRVEKEAVMRNLLALQSDPYMFHQANMYYTGVESITIGDQTGQMSLVTAWTETVLQELMRLTNWPVISMTQDLVAEYFRDRKTVDDCNPQLSYGYSDDGKAINKVIVTANGNSCSRPVPVTLPSGSASASGGSTSNDKVGTEPPIEWVTLNGSPVTLTLASPVTVSQGSSPTVE